MPLSGKNIVSVSHAPRAEAVSYPVRRRKVCAAVRGEGAIQSVSDLISHAIPSKEALKAPARGTVTPIGAFLSLFP